MPKINLRNVMTIHAIFSIIYGTIIIFLPHGLYERTFGDYNFLTHESSRLYGCLTVGIGWLVWKTKQISDGRLTRAVTEAFSISFISQGLVMIKALYSNSKDYTVGSTTLHLTVATCFLIIGVLYLIVRVVKKIKDFELPGTRDT